MVQVISFFAYVMVWDQSDLGWFSNGSVQVIDCTKILTFFPEDPVPDVVKYFVSHMDSEGLIGSIHKLRMFLHSYHDKPNAISIVLSWPL